MPLIETIGSGSARSFGLNSSSLAVVTTSNLITYLDASKSASYPGSGSVWYDISGNGNHANLYSTSYSTSGSGGHINLNGSGYMQLANNSSAAPYANQKFTIDLWVRRYEDSTNYEIMWSQDYTSHTPPYYSVHIRYDNASAHNGVNGIGGTPWSGPTGITSGDSGWINWIFTNDNSGSAIVYKNGVQHNTFSGISPTYYNNPLWIGKSNFMTGSRLMFGSVRYYNRAISSIEAAGNYQATKTRFGF